MSIPIEIAVTKTDDPYFVMMLSSLVNGLVGRNEPAELWIVQIDNWFDHKWLRFSGIGTVDFRFPAFMNRFDAALQEFYQDKVTFPPFAPSRVVSQWSFLRAGHRYIEDPLPKAPHSSEKRPSDSNLQRRVGSFGQSACFVWYSGNTAANGRASVMVYELSRGRVTCWFASFHRQNEWKLQATKGASRSDVESLLVAAS